nr:mechanosensitive ion channel family protein [Oceanobacillus sp. Castelsardo]
MDWIEGINWTKLVLDIGIVALKLIAIIIIYYIVKSIGKRTIQKVFERSTKKLTSGRAHTLQALCINVFTYFLLFIVIGIIFELFGLDIKALLAGAGIIGLAIGFGAQGLVSDVVTGFFILLEKQFDVDDYVTVAGIDGVVEEIGLRTTKLRGSDGTVHYIPNRNIGTVSNYSRGNMRALVDISISHNEDIDKAIQVLQDVCDRIQDEDDNIVEGPNVIGVQSLETSSVVLRVIGKTKTDAQFGVERKLRKMMKEALEQNGMTIS